MSRIFIVLFRGVGGATQLPVKPLAAGLLEAGFERAVTYINSGNAVVASPWGERDAKARIATLAQREFGFTKDIMLVSRADWDRVVAGNPFPEAVDRPTTLHVFVLDGEPGEAAIAALDARAASHERYEVRGKVACLHAPEGFGTSKSAPAVDRILGVATTARNWRTVLALQKLAADVAKG